MKKITLQLMMLFLIVSRSAFAQITLTYDDIPSVGDTSIMAQDTTDLNNLSVGDAGVNKYWDLSGISKDVMDTSIFLNPASTPFVSDFPDANLAGLDADSFYFYIDTSANKIESLGGAGDIIGNGTIAVIKFNPTQTQMLIPTTYLTSFIDTMGYDFKFNGSSWGFDSIRVKSITYRYDTVDAWGSIKTPRGIFSCIRQKTIEKKYDSTWIKYFGLWISAGDDTVQSTSYSWKTNGKNSTLAEIAIDEYGDVLSANYVMFPAAPTSDFTVNDATPLKNSTINFTDLSLADPTSWKWDFGDTTAINTIQNPTHSYANVGTYTVTLISSNSLGSDTLVKIAYINVILNDTLPVANFSYTKNTLTAQFIDSSAYNPNTWLWNFGDGTTSNSVNPTHTFLSTGTYNVCLTVTNTAGSDTICDTLVMKLPPVAAYNYYRDSLTVYFSDLTLFDPESWQWNFGDGSPIDTAQNPFHAYADTGSYSVCLTVQNSLGSDTLCQNIKVYLPPKALFTYTIDSLTVNFTNQSQNKPITYYWTYGDGSVGFTANVSHNYANPGIYNACLYVSNVYGSDSLCKSITIALKPAADFAYSVNGAEATFTDSSLYTPTSWLWDFADTTTSASQNPIHVYGDTGTYIVCLTATNSVGSDTVCKKIVISSLIGIMEYFTEQNINVFPNPCKGKLYINFSDKQPSNADIFIYDVLGKVVAKFSESSTLNFVINLSDKEDGIYFIKIQTEEQVYTKEIVLKK